MRDETAMNTDLEAIIGRNTMTMSYADHDAEDSLAKTLKSWLDLRSLGMYILVCRESTGAMSMMA